MTHSWRYRTSRVAKLRRGVKRGLIDAEYMHRAITRLGWSSERAAGLADLRIASYVEMKARAEARNRQMRRLWGLR